MSNTETTTPNDIGRKITALVLMRSRAKKADDVLRWIDDGSNIQPKVEFRRNTTGGQSDYFATVALPPDAYRVALLLARDHWQLQTGPLEAWLDERKIEHVESAKADD